MKKGRREEKWIRLFFIYFNSKNNKNQMASNFCLCCGGQLSFCGSAWVLITQGLETCSCDHLVYVKKTIYCYIWLIFRVITVQTFLSKNLFIDKNEYFEIKFLWWGVYFSYISCIRKCKRLKWMKVEINLQSHSHATWWR